MRNSIKARLILCCSVDNDSWDEGNCAASHNGAWWYSKCDKSNLNGIYFHSGLAPNGISNNLKGMHWMHDKNATPNALKSVKMMIRPVEE
jgi:hypothetical protein